MPIARQRESRGDLWKMRVPAGHFGTLVRRIAAVVLGTLYLLQATWLLEGGVDLLFPRVVLVKPDAASCCSGACGCRAEKKATKSCCCVPNKTRAPASASVPKVKIQLSAIEESHCQGIGGSLAVLGSLPAIAAAPSEAFVPQAQRLPLVESLEPPPFIAAILLDKVPI